MALLYSTRCAGDIFRLPWVLRSYTKITQVAIKATRNEKENINLICFNCPKKKTIAIYTCKPAQEEEFNPGMITTTMIYNHAGQNCNDSQTQILNRLTAKTKENYLNTIPQK